MACVVVTHDRPECLLACLAAIHGQHRRPDLVVVLDNASGLDTARAIAGFPAVVHRRLDANLGGAAGFSAGIAAALALGADFVWLMDDDGRPADPHCLGALLARAGSGGDVVAPIILDDRQPARLAFPVRLHGRTLFEAAGLVAHGPVRGFAHLFNGVLIRSTVFARIGLPDPRFFIRGDETEFLYRARAANLAIVLDPGARFLHPSSGAEIHPILFGLFYAVVPCSPLKRFYLFRNRAFIFRRYRMWMFLATDVVRYGVFFLVNKRGDFAGFGEWARITRDGVRGRFARFAPSGG